MVFRGDFLVCEGWAFTDCSEAEVCILKLSASLQSVKICGVYCGDGYITDVARLHYEVRHQI